MERYIEILKKSNVSTYFVRELRAKSVELFFIKKKLDMRRMKDDDSAEIIVYKDMEEDGKKLRGSATVYVNPTMSDEEISAKIASAEYGASFVKNPFFELAKPV
ncbi:MAG: TldD/PmbA family protein, partial [Lachnospiraceae bacterium]|nr:TldD/PmbA family protein [Lachnospiraceae bacterium]